MIRLNEPLAALAAAAKAELDALRAREMEPALALAIAQAEALVPVLLKAAGDLREAIQRAKAQTTLLPTYRQSDHEVVEAVCRRLGVDARVMCGRGRSAVLARQRFAVMAELSTLGWSNKRIGRALGRHHSLVRYALAKVGQR